MADDRALEHLRRIATPSRMAQSIALEYMGREWNPYPWILHIEREILGMLSRPGREIMIISVPPQEGKTTYVGNFLVSWYVGMHPDDNVIFIAYSEEYAASWGLKNRNLIEQFGAELFGVELSANSTSVGNWKTQRDFGGVRSVGILGGITGNPGHLIVIDDVIKTMEDAASPAIKKKHIAEWDGSIQTRFQENTKVLLTATRWAEDDLSGEIIRRSKEPDYNGPPVHVIRIGAIAEPDPEALKDMNDEQLAAWRDFLGRKYGEGLQGQHSQGFFEEKRPPSTDVFVWNSLYQGNPSARTGSMFPKTKWRFYDPSAELPGFVAQRRVWDLATIEDGGDWTCGAHVAKTADGRYYVLDMQRFRKSAGDVKTEVKRIATADGWTLPIRIEKERAGAGAAVVEDYVVELAGYDVGPAYVTGSKEQRATPYSGVQNVGKVYLPEGADWVEGFIEEHELMMGDGRRPRHDDQIDVVAYAIIEMLGSAEVEVQDPNDQAYPDVDDRIDELIEQLVV